MQSQFDTSFSQNALLEIYTRMALIRAFETRLQQEHDAGTLPGLVHLYTGQEAIAVATCYDLSDTDWIGSTHRGHGHCIAKGCDVNGMMAEIYGKSTGLCGGKGGSMHIADLNRGMLGANGIVGATPPLILGAALSAKLKCPVGQLSAVAIAFTGDGGANQGTTFESLNFAVNFQLPCIFVIENNGFGQSTYADYAASVSISERAAGFGLPATAVDGTDFFAVYTAVQTALERARSGQGPSLIEAHAKRFGGHHSADQQAYRDADEILLTRAHGDCLLKFREHPVVQTLFNDANDQATQFSAIDEQVLQRVDQAVSFAKQSPLPELQALTTDIYAP